MNFSKGVSVKEKKAKDQDRVEKDYMLSCFSKDLLGRVGLTEKSI